MTFNQSPFLAFLTYPLPFPLPVLHNTAHGRSRLKLTDYIHIDNSYLRLNIENSVLPSIGLSLLMQNVNNVITFDVSNQNGHMIALKKAESFRNLAVLIVLHKNLV